MSKTQDELIREQAEKSVYAYPATTLPDTHFYWTTRLWHNRWTCEQKSDAVDLALRVLTAALATADAVDAVRAVMQAEAEPADPVEYQPRFGSSRRYACSHGYAAGVACSECDREIALAGTPDDPMRPVTNKEYQAVFDSLRGGNHGFLDVVTKVVRGRFKAAEAGMVTREEYDLLSALYARSAFERMKLYQEVCEARGVKPDPEVVFDDGPKTVPKAEYAKAARAAAYHFANLESKTANERWKHYEDSCKSWGVAPDWWQRFGDAPETVSKADYCSAVWWGSIQSALANESTKEARLKHYQHECEEWAVKPQVVVFRDAEETVPKAEHDRIVRELAREIEGATQNRRNPIDMEYYCEKYGVDPKPPKAEGEAAK